MPRANKTIKAKPARPVAASAAAVPRERSEAFDTFARDLLTFAGHFERVSTKRVATGGIGKKTTQRIAPFLRRSDEEYASFLGVFLIDRRVLFEGEDRWEISRPNLIRLWQPGAPAPLGPPFLAAHRALERIARRSRRAVTRPARIHLGRPDARGTTPPPLRRVARRTRRRIDRDRHAAVSTRPKPPGARSRRRRRCHVALRRTRLAGNAAAANARWSARLARTGRTAGTASAGRLGGGSVSRLTARPTGAHGELAGDHRRASAPRSPIPRPV